MFTEQHYYYHVERHKDDIAFAERYRWEQSVFPKPTTKLRQPQRIFAEIQSLVMGAVRARTPRRDVWRPV